jgi:hypothetical protein
MIVYGLQNNPRQPRGYAVGTRGTVALNGEAARVAKAKKLGEGSRALGIL